MLRGDFMFNSVEFVREVCKSKKISIAKLEKDCGFANGYLNPKKLSKIQYDRAVLIAEYLGISANKILTGEDEQKENSPAQFELTEGEIELVKIFRLIPEEQQRAFLEMGRVFADSLKKD